MKEKEHTITFGIKQTIDTKRTNHSIDMASNWVVVCVMCQKMKTKTTQTCKLQLLHKVLNIILTYTTRTYMYVRRNFFNICGRLTSSIKNETTNQIQNNDDKLFWMPLIGITHYRFSLSPPLSMLMVCVASRSECNCYY